MAADQIHFIIGIWRSGTTLIREVLGMNHAIKIFPEHFALLQGLSHNEPLSISDKEIIFDRISKSKDFLYFAKPDLGRLKSNLNRANSFKDVMILAYDSCVDQDENIELYLDKNPIYSYYLDSIMELFPDSKFIWMLREPKDNCISRNKHGIQSLNNYSYLAHWWNYTNQLIAKKAEIEPERFLLIPYDQLVVSPQPWIEKICAFTSIPFDPEMLSFETKKQYRTDEYEKAAIARDRVISESYAKRKAAMWENLQKPINDSKTKQWENELSESQINKIDYLCSHFYTELLKGNFSSTPPTPSLFNELILKASLKKLKWDISRNRK